jgi:hypothetical protein
MKRLVISSVVAVCVVCAVIMLLSRSGSSQSQISDCKEPFGNPPCKANNSATFNNGQNTGCKVEFHWLRCDGVSHGSVFDSCTNIGCKAVCSCSCATNGYGVSWQDTCEDIVKSESFRATGVGRFQRPYQLLRPVLQTVLLVVGILTAVAVYVISLMGFVWETRLAKADVQVAQK